MTADRRPQTADRRPQTADRRPQTADRRPRDRALLTLLLGAALAAPAAAQCGDLAESAQLDFANPSLLEIYGSSISAEGELAAIGAPYDVSLGGPVGAPGFVELRGRHVGGTDAWGLVVRLDPGGSADIGYGAAVALAGDVLAVGAPRFGILPLEDVGRVYLHHRDSPGPGQWGQVAVLDHPAPASGDQFGSAIALWRDESTGELLLAVGAPRDDVASGADAGSVQVFRATAPDGSGWIHSAALTASDGAAADELGNSVAIRGDRVLIGSHQSDHLALDAGSAYLFERSGPGLSDWTQVQRLDAPTDPADAVDAAFGTAVALGEDLVVVGEPGYDSMVAECGDGIGGPSMDIGRVHVFEPVGATWSLVQSIEPSECTGYDWFGSAIGLRDDRLVVGARGLAPFPDLRGSGSAWLFVRLGGDWFEQARLEHDQSEAGDKLGAAVAIVGGVSDAQVLAGAPWLAAFDFRNGRAFAFDIGSTDCNGNGIGDCAELAACSVSDCNGNGIPDDCDVASGAPDCNGDGIPDSCSGDCDADGINDVAALCAGLDEDCNGNLIPDACEADPLFDIVFVVDGSESIGPALWDLQLDGIVASVCGLGALGPVLGTTPPIRLTVIQFQDLTEEAVVYGPVLFDGTNPAPFCASVAALPPDISTQQTFVSDALELAQGILASYPGVVQRRVILSTGSIWSGDHDEARAAADALRDLHPPAVVSVAEVRSAGGCAVPDSLLLSLANDPAAEDHDPCGPIGRYACVETTAEYVALVRGAIVQQMFDCDGNGQLEGCGSLPDDCNCNGIPDCVEIAQDPTRDLNGNQLPDDCEVGCPADVDGDFLVGFQDLLLVLGAWNCDDGTPPCSGCPEDIDGNGCVGFLDLLQVLGNWGWCACSTPAAAPQSVSDCLQKVGLNDPLRLQACIEAMILNGTP